MLFLEIPANGQENWRSDVGIFRTGVILGNDRERELSRMEPFRVALEKALDIDAEFYEAGSGSSLLKTLISGRIEYAAMPPVLYALGFHTCQCLEPIAIAKANDSTDGYHLILLGRAGITRLEDLPRKARIGAFRGEGVTSTSLAIHLLEAAGLEGKDHLLIDYGQSPLQAILALQNGEIDALLGWSSLTGEPATGYSRGTLREFARIGKPLPAIVWRSASIPHLVHVARKNLSSNAKNELRSFLVNLSERNTRALDAISPIHQGGLVAVRNDRFDIFTSYVQTLLPPFDNASDVAGQTENNVTDSPVENDTTPPIQDEVDLELQ